MIPDTQTTIKNRALWVAGTTETNKSSTFLNPKEMHFIINAFNSKKLRRRCTSESPNNMTKNEIDFAITSRKHVFKDIPVINRFNTDSDYRLVRSTQNINFRDERIHMSKSYHAPNF